jgi:uncharacterized protein YcfJ
METEKHDNTRGIAIGGLTTGIIGSALGLLNGNGNGLLGGLFGNGCNNNCGQPNVYTLQQKECEDNLALTRQLYENRLRDVAELNAFREKDIQEKFGLYQNDNANYNALNARISKLETNEAVMAAVEPYRMKIINDKIALEAERRCCADNKIVGYLNGNFQPLYVADMTPATTSTERTTYNPLCDCCGTGRM